MSVSRNESEKVMTTLTDGAASATKIVVAGMTTNRDIVKSVTDLTNNAAISLTGLAYVDGGFKITANTTGLKLLVTWLDWSLG